MAHTAHTKDDLLAALQPILDALTSARAYHAPRSIADVVQLVARGAGVHFDPLIADAVVRLHHRGALAPDVFGTATGPEPTPYDAEHGAKE